MKIFEFHHVILISKKGFKKDTLEKQNLIFVLLLFIIAACMNAENKFNLKYCHVSLEYSSACYEALLLYSKDTGDNYDVTNMTVFSSAILSSLKKFLVKWNALSFSMLLQQFYCIIFLSIQQFMYMYLTKRETFICLFMYFRKSLNIFNLSLLKYKYCPH